MHVSFTVSWFVICVCGLWLQLGLTWSAVVYVLDGMDGLDCVVFVVCSVRFVLVVWVCSEWMMFSIVCVSIGTDERRNEENDVGTFLLSSVAEMDMGKERR